MHRTLALLALSLATSAMGQSQFDPGSYIQSKEAQPELREGEVIVKGVKYKVFKSAAGNLYVPAVDTVTKSDLERSLCANQIPVLLEKCAPDDGPCMQRNRDHMTAEVTVVRADAPLGANTKAYAEIIGTTIQKKCGDVAPTYFAPLSLKPEVGIEYKDTHQRDPNTYKLFYNPVTRPALGFKSEF